MNQFERRVNKLETVTGVGAKSRTLTNSEEEFILFACNHRKPQEEWLTRTDLNDSELLDETGQFPWRAGSSADVVGVHVHYLRKVNERKRKEREIQ